MNDETKEKQELSEQPENGVGINLGGLSPEHKQRIREIAAHEGTTVQSVLRQIIRRGLLASKKNPGAR